MTARSKIEHQVRTSKAEAAFGVAAQLFVNVWQEINSPQGIAASILLVIATAFAVHGLQNAQGLGAWNWIYLPARLGVVALGVAYSYLHFVEFLAGTGLSDRAAQPIAACVELLVFGSLIGFQGHSSRLAELPADPATPVVEERAVVAPQALSQRPAPVADPAPARPTPAAQTDDGQIPQWMTAAIQAHVDKGWSQERIAKEVPGAPAKSSVGRAFQRWADEVDAYRASKSNGHTTELVGA